MYVFWNYTVISTWKEPIPGWTDKAFAPTALVKFLSLGYVSSILCEDDTIVDMIPADYAINALIAIAWDTNNRSNEFLIVTSSAFSILTLFVSILRRFVSGTLTEPRVYNLVSLMDNPLKFKSFLTRVFDVIRTMPSNQTIWYPSVHFHRSKMRNYLCSLIRPKLLVRCFQLYYFFRDKNSEKYSR